MKAYILFQTDIYRSKRSRVSFGVFSSEAKAVDAAKGNGLYTSQAEMVIIECEIDRFEEI